LITGIVFDIKRFSIHDGPGIRTTVFFKGCPLSCWWCHNPESQASGQERVFHERRCIRCGACVGVCQQGAITLEVDGITVDGERCTLCGACADICYAEAHEMVGREMTLAQVMDEIERDVAFYDESGGGVTLSGGEPLSQSGFLLALLRACKQAEIHTVLDTCGFASWDVLDRIRAHVDLFLYDLKVMDEARHRQFTGVSNGPILNNLQSLSLEGHDIVLRVPVIPGFNDDEDNIRELGIFVAALPLRHRVDLLPYHHSAADKYARLSRVYGLGEIRPPSHEAMIHVAEILDGYDLQVKIGG
jgi:pyruvate formate lyase activating enzyme